MATAKKQAKPASAPAAADSGRIDITIHEEAGANPYCDVTVRGYTRRIKRGQRVSVPPEVLGVLDCAIITVSEPDPNNPSVNVDRDIPRFPYTNHGPSK